VTRRRWTGLAIVILAPSLIYAAAFEAWWAYQGRRRFHR
jgi:hypothetical protein